LQLTVIGLREPEEGVVLGGVDTLEIDVAQVEPDKQRHDEIVTVVPLSFEAGLAHQQTDVIGLKLAHPLLRRYEVRRSHGQRFLDRRALTARSRDCSLDRFPEHEPVASWSLDIACNEYWPIFLDAHAYRRLHEHTVSKLLLD
jgi:hypothetical protein